MYTFKLLSCIYTIIIEACRKVKIEKDNECVNPIMNTQQLKRFAKLNTDRFYLLGYENDLQPIFHISGSTRNVYKVVIHPSTSTISCTCPDAKSWAQKYNCICKHALFVLYRVLKVFDNVNHPFFDCLLFTEKELELIQISMTLLQCHLDATVMNDELTARFRQLKHTFRDKQTIKFGIGDLCGVCFLDLEEPADCVSCCECNKAAHTECIKKWIDSGQLVCVYCRQKVWHHGISKNNGDGYDNLGY